MKDRLNDKGIGLLTDILSKGIIRIKENYEWKKLFINTGEFLTDSRETDESFREDLVSIFSKDNLSKISQKLKDSRGYNFTEFLYNELYDLMLKYEVLPMQAETYINHFSQMIIKYLEENDHDKTLEIFLGEWRKEQEERFIKYDKQFKLLSEKLDSLKMEEIKPLSISDMDAKIRRKSLHKGMSLDFFELDDEQFELDFQETINKIRIFVVGKSREETTYRILNELKNKNSDRTVLVISSQKDWRKLENSNIEGCILIPIFYAESISPIPNNTNIFVYGEEEPCYSEDKLYLRKRTRKNIISSLEKIGFESNDACKVVEKTHGLYSALKKKLFGDAIHNEPIWVKQRSDVVMAALLCGKWTESEGDKLIFEELSGKKYDDCKKELLPYSYGDSPYVIQIKGYGGSNMQIASVEDAWEELDKYISDETWEKFIKLFYEVLIESEPIFDYPFDKHFEASVYAAKPEWSQTLKCGMIRTLVMRAYYRQHVENQRQVDEVISKVLKTITTKERWGYISQYFTELCEASPKSVLEKLENEFAEPTGMLELFSANTGDVLTGRHYYTHVLWAVEHLLQQKMYVKRAVDWLWKTNDFNIKYSISNSPKSILGIVYCAWLNVSVLSVEEKIESARKAVASYDNAWEIIYDKLPKGSGGICSSFNTPKYRSVDEPAELYVNDVNNTYVEYLNICVENIHEDAGKWGRIIESLHRYSIKIQEDILNKMIDACQKFSDLSKIQIKDAIRGVVYKHRFFKDAEWGMDDVSIQKYVNAFEKIVLYDKTYDFLYLFMPEYDFPLLNPIPYKREKNDYRNENEVLRDQEIQTQFQIFKHYKYSLEKLIKLAIKDDNCIMGEVLAQYYCKNIFDKEVFKLLLENDSKGKQVYDYVRRLYREGNIDLKEIIETIKKQNANNILIANIIGLELITNKNDAIIAGEGDEVKKAYWGRNLRIAVSENAGEDMWIWALDECKKYGTLSSYLELLFEAKDKISVNTLYEKFLAIRNIEGSAVSMADYYLEKIFKILQEEFRDDFEKCNEIAALELFCRNILEWHQMKCTQYIMKLDPTTYAELVKIIYKSDETEEIDDEKKQLASKMYSLFHKAQFCPAEKDGKVKYEEIKRWIDKFKELLKKQGQDRLFEHLLGRLLAYSPIGDDGYMPCEAVRRIIEENFNESLKSSYVIAEENKRGVHTVDDGKSEKLLAENYEKNAERLREQYPKTAEIFYALRDSYKWQADSERRRAEDEF